MADIKQAIEAAKQDPNSAFATELRRRIESGKFNTELAAAGLPVYTKGLKPNGGGAIQDIKETGQAIVESGKNRVENLKEIASRVTEQSPTSTMLQATGQGAGFIGDVVGESVIGAGKAILGQGAENKVGGTVQKGVEKVVSLPAVQKLIEQYSVLKETNPELAADLDATFNIASLIPIGKGVQLGKNAVETAVGTTAKAVKEGGEAAVNATLSSAENLAKNSKDAFLSFVSPNVDDVTKNVLKNVPTDKFDTVVNIAKEASKDATKPSTYEVVAQAMTKATKQMSNQVKSLAEQKNIIINKAKTGLTDFTKQTNETILDISKNLKNSPIGKSFIDRLKTVKTKLDADKAIDDLQDALYKGNKDMTIPVGSSEDKLLKKIIGTYNTKLKNSLPDSYSKINTEIMERMKALNVLNRSLGEVVDGVSTRGAGLVKQFFSPAGTKTKQLFQYIKDTTGVDLAEDAVLAKYVGEAFGDTKIRSLLGGIPTSRTGAIDTAINVILEKTGAKSALDEAKQSGMLKKARELTKQKK